MGEPARKEASEDRAALLGMGERLFQLVSKGATAAQWREWLRAPLEHALAQGDRELAFGLLKAGANGGTGWEGCDGRTLLGAAAEGGNPEVVSAVLEAGGLEELDTVSGEQNMTALLHAIASGHADAARVLVLEGADVTIADSSKRNAMHYALQGGHLELAKEIVIAGADVNAKDGDGETPLHLAAARGCVEFSSTLLRRGGSLNVANTDGEHPLHRAVENNHADMAEALLKAGADPNVRYGRSQVRSPLQRARYNSTMTRVLLKFGADLKSRDSFGCTVLHWVAEEGEPDVVNALVEAGADLESRSSCIHYSDLDLSFDEMTPLHGAVLYSNIGTMVALLRNGANVDAKDDRGLTPLHAACKASSKERSRVAAVDILLRNGADETITDNEDRAAVDLIKSGADLSGCLRRLLTNAPADRAWRRRGLLVLCRARSDKMQSGVVDGRASQIPCQGSGVAGGATAAAGDGDRTCGNFLVRVVELETEVIFRTIVGFL